ncbi:cytochrome [Actinophytocola xinjiangensis]|uniref:Cytochrome n=1 Tax=Actinophytocola xinjiangensis TaxID=485602 RepID=A0A7Z1AYE9_9PSEU|nr:cytochrome P450 [Actinophytocola xinjiangensis]OLF09087.1 cytochrome [Actinophytocola xinjiangensis]
MPDTPVTMPRERTDPFDPPAELSRLRDQDALHRLSYPDGHVGWLVTQHSLVRTVMSDPRFSARAELRRLPVRRPSADLVVGKPAPPGMFIMLDPPDHTHYRRMLTGQFTVRKMQLLEPRVTRIVEDHLDAMAASGGPVDLVQAFALPVPSLVICELLGVPYTDREEFQGYSATLASLATTAEEGTAAMEGLFGYLRDLIDRKRSAPADDLISDLIAAGELNEEELVNISAMMLIAGHETTANMLSLGTFTLLTHPEQRAAMLAGQAEVNNAVEELLRYLTIIQYGTVRTALEDVELAGRTIRAGDGLTLALPVANRDPDRFDNAHEFDVTRPATGHLAFGHGVHQCIGQQLARVEMRIAFAALFTRFPTLRLDAEPSQIPLRDDMNIYGVHRLPVAW